VAVAPDGRQALACSDDGCLYAVDLERRAIEAELRGHGAAVLCAAFSPDGERAASGSWDRSALLWRRGVPEPVARWDGRGDPVNALVFAPGGERVFLGTFNGEVLEWDPASGDSRLLGRRLGSVKALAPTPDGVVSVGRDGTVRRFERGAARVFRAGESILNGVAASPDGRRLATVSRRNGVELWSARGQRLARFAAHPVSAKGVAFGPGGRIAAVYYDGALALWDPRSGMARLEALGSASLSQVVRAPRGWVASSWDADGTLHLIDAGGAPGAALRIAA
jgi:WD40 repeat protein